MAEYRGVVYGRPVRGEFSTAARLGTAATGIRVSADTWDAGIHVLVERDGDGHDVATVFVTGGSNNPERMRPVYRVDLTEEAKNNQPDQEQ